MGQRVAVVVVMVLGMGMSPTWGLVQERELTEVLKKEQQRIEKRLAEIADKLARMPAAFSEESLKELKQSIDEFALDAELSEKDPLLVRLNEKLETLRDTIRLNEAERMAMEAASKPRAKGERVDPAALLKPPVNLKDVSFKKDVAPIIAAACLRCHNAQQANGKFNASTYAGFKAQLAPGNPEASHLLGLVAGRSQPRMPRGPRSAFTREWLEIWTAWIQQGAKFDGPSPTASITSYLVDRDKQRRDLLASMGNDELEKLHRAQADRQIAIVKPKSKPIFLETKHFLVYTTLAPPDAEYAGALAEAIVEDLTGRFRAKQRPLFRGKYGLNLFADRGDFIAFCQEIDHYRPEPDEAGHLRLLPEHQYLVLSPEQAGFSLDGVVADYVTRALVMQLADRTPPAWAVFGYGRLVAAQYDPQAAHPKQAGADAARVLDGGNNLMGLFREELPWNEQAALAAPFFQFLAKGDKKRANEFMLELARSGNAAGALNIVFRTTPEAMSKDLGAWLAGRGSTQVRPKAN